MAKAGRKSRVRPGKVTRVTLVSPVGEREFDIGHAERLLSIKNNGGWKVSPSSNFTYRKENGLIPISTGNTGGITEAAEQPGVSSGENPSEQD